jgi:hypothetical protein
LGGDLLNQFSCGNDKSDQALSGPDATIVTYQSVRIAGRNSIWVNLAPNRVSFVYFGIPQSRTGWISMPHVTPGLVVPELVDKTSVISIRYCGGDTDIPHAVADPWLRCASRASRYCPEQR